MMVTLTPDSEKFSWVSSCGLQSHFPQGGKVTSDYIALHKVGSKTTIRPKKREEDSNSIYQFSGTFTVSIPYAQFLMGYSSYLKVTSSKLGFFEEIWLVCSSVLLPR